MTSSIRPLNKEFIAERDLRIYQMRAAGIAHASIATQMGMTVAAVSKSLARQTERLNREAALSYPEVLRMELERLDKLHAAMWPLTQHRRVVLDDGTELSVEPDIKAVDTVLKIQASRAKLLGMDAQKVDVNVDVAGEVRHTLRGAEDTQYIEINKKTETVEMIRIMRDSRILDEDAAMKMLEAAGMTEDAEIIDVDAEEIDNADEPT